ncbi:MAG TPA: FprA family A-type flavoprotein [Candidatus Fournierella merdipullorum]|uniref:FprA family A-type flavoprotein n=1 Tax=Candidatus Allofournierella merdipullorum TaxID=2838595 RepID=A0A9D2J112_9FIRM|nr:FprA family A-type flavoprotein [Candidatus Fournierella merdipullorum]
MSAIKAMDDLWWVGVEDHDLRVFDIVMHSDWGTSYNAYAVRGTEGVALFETVKEKFFDEYLANLKEVCSLDEVRYIVVGHTEPDHSGSLEKLLDLTPNATVVGSATAITFLKEIVNKPFASRAVKDGETIDLGGRTLSFLSVPFLHWPDSMYTYIPELGALFTVDSFGCHYADDRVFNDLIDGDFTEAYKYYFDCIMGPFKPFVLKALDKIKGLDIRFIGNGHGPVLRTDIPKYLEMYRAWATPVVVPADERRVAIAYVSAYGYTRQLAGVIADALAEGGVKHVELYDLVECDLETARAAVQSADGFLLGSPTLVGDALPPIYEMLVGLNPIIHKGKPAGAFGSYGWSGEAVPKLTAQMQAIGLKLPVEGLKVRFKPSEAQLAEARQFGLDFAAAVLA